jgi:hypothetical protein
MKFVFPTHYAVPLIMGIFLLLLKTQKWERIYARQQKQQQQQQQQRNRALF